MKYALYIFVVLGIFLACRKDKVGYKATPYVLDVPSHFPDMIIPSDNPMTAEGVELGRYLFYEKKLSGPPPLITPRKNSLFLERQKGFLERRNSKIYTPSLNSARDHSISET